MNAKALNLSGRISERMEKGFFSSLHVSIMRLYIWPIRWILLVIDCSEQVPGTIG